ncbi:MAG: signal peptidase I [Deltaproteobacteria bacterium]|nr:signal peptidase I [Deltaproteobacteria bacterium]
MKLRYFSHKFWYVVWFVALPLSISWITIDLLDRARVVDEFEPWYVLLLFAILVVLLYSSKNKLPFWRDKDFDSQYNRSRRVKNAIGLMKRVHKIMTRHPAKISEKNTAELKALIHSLENAIEKKEHGDVQSLAKKLEAMANKHLAFAQKSPGREYFESIGIAVLVAFGLRLFAVEAFKIPSESMVPTLMVGDHIFVSKYQYGISLPFQNKKLVQFGPPAYGDVIVFAKPSRQEQGYANDGYEETLVGTDFIKRVIGLPGDTIEVKRSVVYVNGKPISRCKVGKRSFKSRDSLTDEWVDRSSSLWVEKHGDHSYTIVEEYLFDDFEPVKVPDDQVFVMGDNRDRSSDSRMWGTVPLQNIKGRAMVIWWSNKRPHGFEWDRVGSIIMGAPDLTEEQEKELEKCALK